MSERKKRSPSRPFEVYFVISTIWNSRFRDYVSGHINSEWLKDIDARLIYETILSMIAKNKSVTFLSVYEMMKRDTKIEDSQLERAHSIIFPFIENPNLSTLQSMLDSVIPVVEEEMGKIVLSDGLAKAVSLWEENRFQDVFSLFRQIEQQAIYAVPNVIEYWQQALSDDYEKGPAAGWKEGIKTGICGQSLTGTDNYLDNSLFYKGIGRGQLGIILALSGKGKSTFCLNVAAYQSLAGYNVDYYTLEMPPDYMLARIDSLYSNIPTWELRSQEGRARAKEIIREVKERYPNSKQIQIYQYNPYSLSPSMVAKNLTVSQKEGRQVDSVFIDYIDVMRPSKNYHERRHEIGLNTLEMRSIAGEFDCSVITPSQSNRMNVKGEKHLNKMNASEDFSKVFTCDILLTLNIKREEYENVYHEKKSREVCIVYVDKNRFGPDGQEYQMILDRSTGKFYSPIPGESISGEMEY